VNVEDLKNLKILFVDDEQIQRMLMENILKRNFKEVVIAKDGLDALEIFQNENFDIVVTDFTMPEMNGWDLIKNIREIKKDQKCAILTGNEPEELKDYFQCDAPILRKPFKRVEGLNALLDILS